MSLPLRTAAIVAVGAALALTADPALTISGVAGRDRVQAPPLGLTLDDFAKLPHTTVKAKDHNGQEHSYEGVLLSDLLKRAGMPTGADLRGSLLATCLVAEAHDGYRAVFSLPELDPAFTEAQAIVIDRMDGKPLSRRDGPLRIVVPAEKREARWVRMVERLRVVHIEAQP